MTDKTMTTKQTNKTKPATPAKKGRPVTLPADLDKRWQVRCNSRQQLLWEALARLQNLPDASTLVRKVMADQIKELSPKQREELEAIADQLEADAKKAAA